MSFESSQTRQHELRAGRQKPVPAVASLITSNSLCIAFSVQKSRNFADFFQVKVPVFCLRLLKLPVVRAIVAMENQFEVVARARHFPCARVCSEAYVATRGMAKHAHWHTHARTHALARTHWPASARPRPSASQHAIAAHAHGDANNRPRTESAGYVRQRARRRSSARRAPRERPVMITRKKYTPPPRTRPPCCRRSSPAPGAAAGGRRRGRSRGTLSGTPAVACR